MTISLEGKREQELHISNEILEKLAVDENLLPSSVVDVARAHLSACKKCAEVYHFYFEINSSIENEIKSEALPIDTDVAKRLLNKQKKSETPRLLVSNNSIQIFDGRTEIVKRPNLNSITGIIYLFKNFPAQSSGFALVAIFAIGFIILSIKSSIKDLNPVTLKVEQSVLHTYNLDGELLWKKNIDGVPQYGIDSLTRWVEAQKRFINLTDIDNDGKNELLISGKYEDKGLIRTDSLYCFNYDGTKRWTISPEDKKLDYAPSWKRTYWQIEEFFTVKTKLGTKLFVYAHVASFGGTVISEVDPANGKILSSLYHSGYSSAQYHFDLDNDGNDEIIFGGTSSFNRPFFLVLKTDYLMGVMPDYYTKQNYIKGNAVYYVLLPVSDLGKLLSTTVGSNVASIYRFNQTGIALLTNDVSWSEKERITIQYTFDSLFVCKTITGGTSYKVYYEQYFKSGKLKKALNSQYLESLRDSILYWNGDEFVTTPQKNKYHNQPFRLP